MLPFEGGDPPHWIFGYGSLIWRPDFDFEEQQTGTLLGWERRFWQGSTDHRGVPGKPGRVVTLVPVPQGRCVGVAYRLNPTMLLEVLERLDHREKGGYRRLVAEVPLADGRVEKVLTYWADDSNDNYLGPAALSEMAAQIRSACGPSGANAEYVLKLAQSLQALDARDSHIQELALLVGDSKAQNSA